MRPKVIGAQPTRQSYEQTVLMDCKILQKPANKKQIDSPLGDQWTLHPHIEQTVLTVYAKTGGPIKRKGIPSLQDRNNYADSLSDN